MVKTEKTVYNIIRGDIDMLKTFNIVICKDNESDGYWATCLELHGCNTQADTVEEIIKNMKDEAIPLCLEDYYHEIKTVDAKKIASYLSKNNPLDLEYCDYEVIAVKTIALEAGNA